MERRFRRSLLGWFMRLPFGIGFATLRACLRIACGCKRSGVASAGNGAAMRAVPVGAFLFDDPDRRRRIGRALAEVTHTDPRAIDGALFVAEIAAEGVCTSGKPEPSIAIHALAVVQETSLRTALERALALAVDGRSMTEAAAELGTTGFVVH
jgi:ADP-ribosylglycohydrolase